MQTTVLIENLQLFVAFARKRVGDAHLAEDVVQESLLKALQAERKPARARARRWPASSVGARPRDTPTRASVER